MVAQAINLLILKYTTAEASHQFCTVTAPRHWPLHIKARDTLRPLCAVCMSPLRGGLGGQAAGAPSTECCEQQAWLLICCGDKSHAQSDILRGQPLWLTLVEFTQHVKIPSHFPGPTGLVLTALMMGVLQGELHTGERLGATDMCRLR